MNVKTKKKISIALYFGVFLYNVYPYIVRLINGYLWTFLSFWSPTHPIFYFYLIMLVCPLSLGIIALRDCKLPTLTKVMAMLYVIASLWGIVYAMLNARFSVPFLILLIMFVCAYILSVNAEERAAFFTSSNDLKTTGEISQTFLYEQQLKDGIINQEEYDQLIRRR